MAFQTRKLLGRKLIREVIGESLLVSADRSHHGIAMLSSVLHSERAVAINIEIMRAFIKLRRLLASHEELARRLSELERKYDKQFASVFEAIRQMMEPPKVEPREMGYHTLIRPSTGK